MQLTHSADGPNSNANTVAYFCQLQVEARQQVRERERERVVVATKWWQQGEGGLHCVALATDTHIF